MWWRYIYIYIDFVSRPNLIVPTSYVIIGVVTLVDKERHAQLRV